VAAAGDLRSGAAICSDSHIPGAFALRALERKAVPPLTTVLAADTLAVPRRTSLRFPWPAAALLAGAYARTSLIAWGDAGVHPVGRLLNAAGAGPLVPREPNGAS
jgi:hypothetical protein